jgi:hypothetical protein
MPEKKRAVRRFHKARMKSKARKVYPDWDKFYKWADNLAGCSCHMCGNPRKHYEELTRAEIKARLDAEEQENDLG